MIIRRERFHKRHHRYLGQIRAAWIRDPNHVALRIKNDLHIYWHRLSGVWWSRRTQLPRINPLNSSMILFYAATMTQSRINITLWNKRSHRAFVDYEFWSNGCDRNFPTSTISMSILTHSVFCSLGKLELDTILLTECRPPIYQNKLLSGALRWSQGLLTNIGAIVMITNDTREDSVCSFKHEVIIPAPPSTIMLWKPCL